ncbi:type VI secretion system baseplate subunit TssE [Methylobacterium indicum]|uniref:type VI secretion system baseplate subunit TssE n=1 Tax=Methylobacterium indicum TaxID=1775910 RepID=UPI002435810B|nr:type VI secretion system baseplate subunit TssE [Methylobacterium indicum]
MRLQPSLLDRLIDDEPQRVVDPPRSRADELRRVREGFRRDLEALLNTRRLPTSPPAGLDLVRAALPHYGVEDFVGAPLATPEQRADLARALETTIQAFEPRFRTVTVTVLKGRDPLERLLRIRIEAAVHLSADQAPEPVTFETALDPAIRSFSVESRHDG